MKKIAFLLLTLAVAFSLSGCFWLEFVLSVADGDGPSSALGNPYVQVAFEGDFSEEKLRDTIADHEEYFYPLLYRDAREGVSFEVDYEIKSAGVSRLSRTSSNDIEVELNGYIDLAYEPDILFSGKKITAYPAEFSAADLERCAVWSYLVYVTDTEGGEHYYYFRVDYFENIPSRV